MISKATLNKAVPSSDTKTTCSWVCFFYFIYFFKTVTHVSFGLADMKQILLLRPNLLYRIGVPYSLLLWSLLLRVHSCPQGLGLHPDNKASRLPINRYERLIPLPLRRTSSMVHFIFRSSPWDQAGARLQLRLASCLDFFPCSVRLPILLFSWEQLQSIIFTKMPTRALRLWKRTHDTWAQHIQRTMISLHSNVLLDPSTSL